MHTRTSIQGFFCACLLLRIAQAYERNFGGLKVPACPLAKSLYKGR